MTFRQWLAAHNRSQRELRQFALGLAVNQKKTEIYPEYLYDGTPCQGLADAAEFEWLCLSFLSAGEWDVPEVTITRRTLDETTVKTIDEQLTAHHASTTYHLIHHKQWIETRTDQIERERLQGVTSAKEFWSRREELFPNLEFCENMRDLLEEIFLNTHKLRGVNSKLRELNSAIGEWDTSKPFDHRQLRNATTESTSREEKFQQKLTQRCPDGIHRLFTWHVRFTPDEGRIYFYPVQHTRHCYVGYIGSKIL